VSNENELVDLRGVEPEDSVSCIAVKANPFETQVFELQPSALSIIDEIFRPPQTAPSEPIVYFDANHKTKESSSPPKLDFYDTPAMANEVFGPPSFDQEFEETFNQVPVALKADVDVWRSLDLEPDRRTTIANETSTSDSPVSLGPRRISPPNAGYMRRYDPYITYMMGKIMNARQHDYPPRLVESQCPLAQPFEPVQSSGLELPETQEECWDEDDYTSDSETATGPQIFWRGSEWSAEDDFNSYAQTSDWESEDSDVALLGTIGIDSALSHVPDSKFSLYWDNGHSQIRKKINDP
jgi:hypothetical protein